MRYLIRCVLLVLLVGGLAATAFADAKVDSYGVALLNNNLIQGGGSGYNNGTWYYYPATGWWNEWFYDDPLDMTRWKRINYSMMIMPYDLQFPFGPVDIAINWSSPGYVSGSGQPPLPPLDSMIVRDVVFSAPVLVHEEVIYGEIVIPNYNPEWVSIDVRGQNVYVANGMIRHECVPEPGTLALLGMGMVGLIAFAWRRRK